MLACMAGIPIQGQQNSAVRRSFLHLDRAKNGARAKKVEGWGWGVGAGNEGNSLINLHFFSLAPFLHRSNVKNSFVCPNFVHLIRERLLQVCRLFLFIWGSQQDSVKLILTWLRPNKNLSRIKCNPGPNQNKNHQVLRTNCSYMWW